MTQLLTIPLADLDRSFHALPIALTTMQARQPVCVRLLDTSGGKLGVVEAVDPFTPPDRINGVLIDPVDAGRPALVAAGQLSTPETTRIIITGVMPEGAQASGSE